MKQYSFIHVFGKCKAPPQNEWKNNVRGGINRLYYIIGGEGGYYIKGEKRYFKKGLIYFIPAYDNIPTWSSYESPEKQLDHLYASIEILPPIITNDVIEIDPKEDPVIEAALFAWMRIAEKYRYIRNIDSEALEYLKANVNYIISRMIDRSNIKTLDDKTILSALEEIHRNIASHISVHDIAKNAHMSYDGFIKKFKSELRTTPYQYIKALKMRTAAALRDEGATLEEAAERCGYSDSSALLHALSAKNDLKKPGKAKS